MDFTPVTAAELQRSIAHRNSPSPGRMKTPSVGRTRALKLSPLVLSIAALSLGGCGGTNGDDAALAGLFLVLLAHSGQSLSAAGPVAVWQPCSDLPQDGGTSELCTNGNTCVVFTVAGGPAKTMCAPLCAPAGTSGPSCSAGQTCFLPESSDFGFCLTGCAGGQSCPAPTTCQGYGSHSFQECLP
jgi:hypothetical protein